MATLGGTDFRWPNLSNVNFSNLIGRTQPHWMPGKLFDGLHNSGISWLYNWSFM